MGRRRFEMFQYRQVLVRLRAGDVPQRVRVLMAGLKSRLA